MAESMKSRALKSLEGKGKIEPGDVLTLRRDVFADSWISREEAQALIALEKSDAVKCGEWSAFFIEAVTDFVVRQEKPSGYISDENADWLIGMVSKGDEAVSLTALELLVTVLEKAKRSPERLVALALHQVELAVLEGRGPLSNGRSLQPGVIGRAEVELLRRILYAFGGDGNIAITRAEAEVLMSINDRTAEQQNDPAWSELFVKAVANCVMCASGYEAPSREEALRRDAFFDRADADIGGFFRRMVSGGVSGILDAYLSTGGMEDAWKARNRALEDRTNAAESVEAEEAHWLADRIGRDGRMHENERELLTFLKRHSTSIHPSLMPLLDRVA